MSVYPLMIEGTALRALVVGGGDVAARKARALVESGAQVRVVAEAVGDSLRELSGSLTLETRPYERGDIRDALLVVAATSSRAVNAEIAREAQSLGRLVNVVDAPAEGNCVTPATHRAGDLVIAVTAGRVPAAAARVRDAIAARYSDAYARAVERLGSMRTDMLTSGRREEWSRASEQMIGRDFCEAVERGDFAARMDAWR